MYGANVALLAQSETQSAPSATDWLSAFASIIQALAIVVGGGWAYRKYLRGRFALPRAGLEQQVRHLLVGGSVLVHVNVVITNPGTVVLRLRRATLRIQQVLPLYGDIRRAVAEGRDPVLPGEREVLWPELGARELSDLRIEIEPGENDEVAADFVVREGVQTIEVYTYFENAQKRGRAMGWSQTTLYDLNPDPAVTAKLVREIEEADSDLASATAGEQQQAPEGG